jgi:hypothetical protein
MFKVVQNLVSVLTARAEHEDQRNARVENLLREIKASEDGVANTLETMSKAVGATSNVAQVISRKLDALYAEGKPAPRRNNRPTASQQKPSPHPGSGQIRDWTQAPPQQANSQSELPQTYVCATRSLRRFANN